MSNSSESGHHLMTVVTTDGKSDASGSKDVAPYYPEDTVFKITASAQTRSSITLGPPDSSRGANKQPGEPQQGALIYGKGKNPKEARVDFSPEVLGELKRVQEATGRWSLPDQILFGVLLQAFRERKKLSKDQFCEATKDYPYPYATYRRVFNDLKLALEEEQFTIECYVSDEEWYLVENHEAGNT